MAESTSQLQAKLKALTHGKVDIMLDEDTFKSTTQILREMSEAWEDMTDIERASALELMGGKRQANILSSVITNFETVEDVIETSMNSSGSAIAENERWMDSIEGKTYQFTNAIETMWSNMLDSEVIKAFIDFGTNAIKFLDTAPGKITAILAALAGFSKLKGIGILGLGKDAASSLKTYQQALYKIQSLRSIGVGADNWNTSALNAYASAVDGLTAKKQAEMLATAGLNKTQIIEVMQRNKVGEAVINETLSKTNLMNTTGQLATTTVSEVLATQLSSDALKEKAVADFLAANGSKTLNIELIQQMVNQGILNTEQAAGIISAYGLAGANNVLAGSFKTLGLAIQQMFLSNPIGFLMMIIPLLITIGSIVKKYIPTTEKYIEKWEEVKDELKELNNEIETTSDRIKELEGKSALSLVDKQELNLLKQTNAELERRKSILEAEEEIAAEKARISVQKDYERDFVREAVRTDRDAAIYNEAFHITNAIQKYKSGASIDSLTEEQIKALKKQVPELYNIMAQTTWDQLDSNAAKAVNDAFANFENVMVDYDYITGTDKTVSGELYIDQAIQKIKEYKDQLYNIDGTLKDGIDDTTFENINNDIDELEAGLINAASALYSYMDDYGGDENDPFVKKLQEQIDKIDMIVNPIRFYNKKFDEIFGKYSDEKEALYELAKQGKLTANDLNNTTYAPLMRELGELGITTQDVVDHIKSLSDADIEKVLNPTFNIADYADGIDSIQEKLSTLYSALESLESGTFTYSDFIDLTQQFPDLAKGVDTSSKSFNGLAQNLRKAIKASPDELIDDLKALRKQLVNNGKSTEAIDQLIDSLENLPIETVKDLSGEYATLADKINAATKAQNELKEAMNENPNEGFETRGEAMDYMKDKMSRGEIGSESELWNVAEKYGFTYDSAKSINENADALADFIAVREKWYKKDDDGNYTYEGTEDFIESVENAVNSEEFKKAMESAGLSVEDFIWKYDEATGALDFDFDNSNWDAIVSALSKTNELAGLTSGEFKDLLTQIGQFFGIDWEDGNDILDYIDKLRGDGTTPAEIFNVSKPVIESYLEENGVSLNWLKGNGYQRNSLDGRDFSDDIKNVIKEYWKLKDEFEADPLSINVQLEKDFAENIADGFTEESLSAINQLVSTAHDEDTGVTWLSIDKLREEAQEAGMDVDTLMEKIYELQKAGKIVDLNTTEKDPLGLASMASSAETTLNYLQNLGLTANGTYEQFMRLGGFSIDLPSFVDMMVEAGWDSAQIQTYISNLNSQGYTFTYKTEENKVETLDVNTEDGKLKVDELVTTANSLTTTETLTVNLDGTAEGALATMQSIIESLTSKVHTVRVNIVTSGSLPNLPTSSAIYGGLVNGTAHAQGTAYAGGSWGAKNTETALVGELGPEILVHDGRWTTVGENGAEFTQVRKGDIIFNHKQSEQLLKNGYVTGRGKLHGSSFASGTAFVDGNGYYGRYEFDGNGNWAEYDVNGKVAQLEGAFEDAADSVSEFEETMDWIAIRMEEYDEKISRLNAELENEVGHVAQNNKIDEIIAANNKKLADLKLAAPYYENKAESYLAGMSKELADAARNGEIAITEFTKDQDEKTIEAIEKYREYAQLAAEKRQEIEEIETDIADLSKQKFDNSAKQYENEISLIEQTNTQLENEISLMEESGNIASPEYYERMKENTSEIREKLKAQKKSMQDILDAEVRAGRIEVGSDRWYEMVNAISDVDVKISDCTQDLETYQNKINDINWDNFDELIKRIDYIKDETQNIIDLMDDANMVITPETEDGWSADDVQWTDEGLATLGLYAQQMEAAEYRAKQYGEAIDNLNKDYEAGKYSESEYLEKLNELKEGQYESIEDYNKAKKSIKDINETRIDAIKNGIEKEIEAYEKLIDKKKESLDADRDAYEFTKSTMEQQKSLADIQRKLAALEGDNSASAVAQKKKLKAEEAKALAELDESYYDRSVENQQNALDKELESFEEQKNEEIEKWEKYLDNVEQIVTDSLNIVQANANDIVATLIDKANEYNLTVSDAILSPWKDGSLAVSDYQTTFDTAMSSTMNQLEALKSKWQEVIDTMAKASKDNADAIDKTNESYTVATKQETVVENKTPSTEDQKQEKAITIGGKINAGSARIYENSKGAGGGEQYFSSDPIYTVLDEENGYLLVRHHKSKSGATGWFKKSDVKAYAKGSTGIKEDQLAILHELGDELQLIPGKNGRLEYVKKGTGIIPSNLTERLIDLAMDPQEMLDRNRPSIGVHPEIHNTEIQIDNSIGELIHIDKCEQSTLPDVEKIVNNALERHTQRLNQSLRKYAR